MRTSETLRIDRIHSTMGFTAKPFFATNVRGEVKGIHGTDRVLAGGKTNPEIASL